MLDSLGDNNHSSVNIDHSFTDKVLTNEFDQHTFKTSNNEETLCHYSYSEEGRTFKDIVTKSFYDLFLICI